MRRFCATRNRSFGKLFGNPPVTQKTGAGYHMAFKETQKLTFTDCLDSGRSETGWMQKGGQGRDVFVKSEESRWRVF